MHRGPLYLVIHDIIFNDFQCFKVSLRSTIPKEQHRQD
jgi:hypothetical protein